MSWSRRLGTFAGSPPLSWDHPAQAAAAQRNLGLLAAAVARLEAQDRADDPPATAGVCRQEHFAGPAFLEWRRRLASDLLYHRKLWEWVWICRTLDERGLLQAGSRGLGFGTGREPLAAAFAARGCEVLATDQAAGTGADPWQTTGQWSGGLEGLAFPAVCPPDQFAQRVRYRSVDMNAVPADLAGFDFTWSVCALEHLGSLEAGLRFVEESVRCLRPGGVAVHTLEYNVSSNDATVERGETVIYRRRDVEGLVRRLEAAGHEVAPIDWDAGDGILDRYVDLPPYGTDAHLRLMTGHGYVMTSLAVVVRRGTS